MCGLFGFADRRDHEWERHLARAVRALAHRGPDDEGSLLRTHHGHTVGLGHRRLSIRDLSPRGRQPFIAEDGRTAAVANGEIYNAAALRAELEAAGHRFHSESDNEVILHGYEEWGPAVVERLEGMFALAVFSQRDDTLFLARDRLGIKPLFIARTSGGLAFGSELRGLLDWPGVTAAIDPHALHEFLAFGYVLAPRTLVAGIHKVRPAHWLRFDLATGELAARRYWSLEGAFRSPPPADDGALPGAFWERLGTGVADRMVADVPVGTFLSGGIDSTAVSALSAARAPGLHSFCCEFAESDYSEGDDARRVARWLGLSHESFVLAPPSGDDLERLVRAADEPLADTSFVPCERLAAFARRSSTVILSGDGADELLAGYVTYRADRYHELLRRLPLPLRRWLADRVAPRIPSGWSKVGPAFRARQFLGAAGLEAALAHIRWRTLWWPRELAGVLAPAFTERLRTTGSDPTAGFRARFEEVADLPFLAQSLYVDLSTWLPDDILAKVDRASMAHGLEVRVPFLDHRLVEWCAPLPPAWKLADGTGKRILRAALRAHVGEVPVQRKKKGFNAPVGHWLNGALRATADELLDSAPELGHGWFAGGPAFQRMLDEHRSGRSDHGLKLWSLVWLLAWIRQTGATIAEEAPPLRVAAGVAP